MFKIITRVAVSTCLSMFVLFIGELHRLHPINVLHNSIHLENQLIMPSFPCFQSPDDLKSMAVEAVLLLQGKISDEEDDTVSIRLLVPSKVIGCIIGKSGSIINEIRKRTKADVRISKGDKPKCADGSDELVEVCFLKVCQICCLLFLIYRSYIIIKLLLI